MADVWKTITTKIREVNALMNKGAKKDFHFLFHA